MRNNFLLVIGTMALICLIALGLYDVAFADDGVLRSFLKTGSAVAAIFCVVGTAVAGYFSGNNYDSHTGWERYHHGAGQFYNRRPFRQDSPTYGVSKETQRVNAVENLATPMDIMQTGSISNTNLRSPTPGPTPMALFSKIMRERFMLIAYFLKSRRNRWRSGICS